LSSIAIKVDLPPPATEEMINNFAVLLLVSTPLNSKTSKSI
jgi:hypothetical protein